MNSSDFKFIKEESYRPSILSPDQVQYLTIREGLEPSTAVLEAGYYWEIPDVHFRGIYSYLKKDPGLQSAWNKYTNDIIGPGFHISCEDEACQEMLDQWVKDTRFETKLITSIRDEIGLGVSLIEPLYVGKELRDISVVDMRTIIAAQRDKFGKTKYYVHQSNTTQNKLLPAENYWEFRFIDVGRQAWPIGLFHSLMIPFFNYENEEWALSDVVSLMTADYARIIHKMAAPRVWHTYEGWSEELLKAQRLRDKDMKAGERGYTSKAPVVTQESFDSQARFKEYIEWISNRYENGTQAPTAKIMTAAGISNATYASTQTADEMFQRSIEGYHRKKQFEIENMILRRLVEQSGYDFDVVKPTFNWGMPDKVQVDMSQVLALFHAGGLSIEELRKIAAETGIPIDTETPFESPQQQQMKSELEKLRKSVSVLNKKERLLKKIAERYKLE